MTQDESESAANNLSLGENDELRNRYAWRDVMLCACAILTLLVLRLPINLHQPGIQDEQFFAVPGLTMLREGVPRIPYLPTANAIRFLRMPIDA